MRRNCGLDLLWFTSEVACNIKGKKNEGKIWHPESNFIGGNMVPWRQNLEILEEIWTPDSKILGEMWTPEAGEIWNLRMEEIWVITDILSKFQTMCTSVSVEIQTKAHT